MRHAPLRGWRAAFRVALAELRGRRGRTALTIALVALPAAATVLTATAARSLIADPTERRSPLLGAAEEALVATAGDSRALDEAARLLPGGTRTALVRRSSAALVLRDGLVERVAAASGVLDPLGGVRIERGRAPRADDEVAVTRDVLGAAGVRVGERLRLSDPPASLVVTGIATRDVAVPGRALVVTPGLVSRLAARPFTVLLVDLPQDGALPRLPRGVSSVGSSDADTSVGSDDVAARAAGLVGAAGIAVGALVAASALAVSARRHVQQLGLLAAVGATTNQLRGVMTATGALVGVGGGVIGAVTGLVGSVGGVAVVDRFSDRPIDGLDLRVGDPVQAFVVAAVAATAAAWIPAFAACRVPPLAALAGRRPVPRIARHWPALGALLAVAGVGIIAAVLALPYARDLTGFVVFGWMLATAGTALATPAVVASLGPLARVGRGASRLALRSVVRARATSAAVAAAVMVVTALGLGTAAALQASEAGDRARPRSLGPDQAAVSVFAPGSDGTSERPEAARVREATAARAAAAIDAVASAEVRRLVTTGTPPSAFVVAAGASRFQAALLDTRGLLGALQAPPAARQALDDVGVVAFVSPGSPEGRSSARVLALGPEGRIGKARVEVVRLASHRAELVGTAVVARAVADRFGLVSTVEHVLLRAAGDIKADTRRRLAEVAAPTLTAPIGADVYPFVRVEEPVRRWGAARAAVAAGVALLSLLVVAIALALSAAEERGERAVLHAVGSGRTTARWVAGVKASALSAIGAVLAVPVGVAAGTLIGSRIALRRPLGESTRLADAVPWSTVVFVVVIAPIAVGCVVALFTKGRWDDGATALLAAD